MPKLKTKKSIKKRFRVTRTGKVLRRSGGHRHLMEANSSKKKRQQRRVKGVFGKIGKNIRDALRHTET
jgi:large subunit ribosomal protein L35